MGKHITHWQPDIEVLKNGPTIGVCGKQGWVTMHLKGVFGMSKPNCPKCLAIAKERRHCEPVECRECGLKLHPAPNGEHPEWFNHRLCCLCWHKSKAKACPDCHGDGYRIVGSGYANEFGEEMTAQETCLACGGTGEVTA